MTRPSKLSHLDGIRASAERRASLARAAHAAVHDAHGFATGRRGDAATAKAWDDAIERSDAVRALCYPVDFWPAFDDLKRQPASPGSIEIAILFLEEDEMFFRSGYCKASTIKRLLRQPLDREQVVRLGEVVLGVVDRRASQEFRRYCRLAVRVVTPDLRAELELRRDGCDRDVSRRAAWVLDALARANQ